MHATLIEYKIEKTVCSIVRMFYIRVSTRLFSYNVLYFITVLVNVKECIITQSIWNQTADNEIIILGIEGEHTLFYDEKTSSNNFFRYVNQSWAQENLFCPVLGSALVLMYRRLALWLQVVTRWSVSSCFSIADYFSWQRNWCEIEFNFWRKRGR